MQHALQRARLRPGPLPAVVLIWFVLTATVLRAHDPGLSALDVSVSGRAIAVSLSLAATDLAPMTRARAADASSRLRELALDAVRLSVDGDPIQPVRDAVAFDDGGARIVLSFEISRSTQPTSLTVTSDVPKRLARGHRELLVVTVSGRVAIEALLDVESDSVTVDLEAASSSAIRRAWSFLVVGVGHILSGYDHLVFLAGLLLAARRVRELVIALTAFTAAHSVSLALVVFGGVQAPASIVEPLIALSITWIGVEIARGLPTRGFNSQFPVANARSDRGRLAVVFGVGLVHGFGFAGALTELGYGSSVAEVALALFSFNAGVEAGQLAVAAALLPFVWMLRSHPLLQAKLLPVCSALIAIAGGYWLLARLAQLLTSNS